MLHAEIERRGKHTMSLESIEEQAAVETDAESGRVERFGLGGGLSEMDFLSRQRYLENSGSVCV